MAVSIFDFRSYKGYLQAWLQDQPKAGHGQRSRMAEVIGTQTGFITQVLGGAAHFSPEQIFALSRMLGHGPEEIQFFQLLLQIERAGAHEFRRHLEGQLEKILGERKTLTKRLKSQEFPSEVDENKYFSSWLYACLHVMTTCQRFQKSRAEMAKALNLPSETVTEAVQFLIRTGLVVEEKGLLKTGHMRLHLGTDSPYLAHHHRNWNLLSLQKVLTDYKRDLHYSSVVSLSAKDLEKVREIFMRAIEDGKKVVRESEGEKIAVATLNFFEVC